MYSYATSVLFVCRLCKSSFQIVDDFIEHKKEEHSVEFRTSNCIVFEDIFILNTCNDEYKTGTLSTVREKDNALPLKENPSVPVPGMENYLIDDDLDLDMSHIITQQNSHDPLSDLHKPFPVTNSDLEKDVSIAGKKSDTRQISGRIML